MLAKIKSAMDFFIQHDPHERRKMLLLSLCFGCLIGAYSVLHSLKPTVFAAVVGLEHQPYTQWISISMVVPFMFVFSFMVNRYKQYQVLFYLCAFYSFMGFFFSYALSLPEIGLSNPHAHIGRLIGWAFYLYVDFYQIIILSTFWAFSNTISSPESAKRNYGFQVAFSKIPGGLAALAAGFAVRYGAAHQVAASTTIPVIILCAAAALLVAGLLGVMITRKVPQEYLHGYEAAYQADAHHVTEEKVGFLEGLKMMVRHNYVLGIFVMVYCFELISAILDYQMHTLMWQENARGLEGMSTSMFSYTATFQAVGFLFAFFGTTSLLRYLDVKICLLLMPVVSAILIAWFVISPSLHTIFFVMVTLRAMHYSFDTPVREILYIPTVKAIRFKSKAWIDSFGRTFSRTSASAFNLSVRKLAASPVAAGSVLTMGIASLWVIIAIGMARKYTSTVNGNQVIGQDESAESESIGTIA